MAEELSDEEQALLEKHRKAKAKTTRKVRVRGKHEESGAEYDFDLDGDDAERVISRHRSLFAEPDGDGGEGETGKKAGVNKYFKGKQAEGS